MKKTVFALLLITLGTLLGGCAGEIATYQLAKEGSNAYNANDYTTALEKWQAGLEQARISENKRDSSMFLYNIGLVYDKLSQYQEALNYYRQALEIRQEIADKRGQANTLNNIGIVYDKLSQHREALDYYRQALKIRRDIDDKAGEGNTLNNIGAVYWNLGQYQEALEQYQQALKIKRTIEDKRGEGNTLNNIGGIHETRGQYQEALDYYQQALTVRHDTGDKRGEASTLNNIGVVYWNLGQYLKALEYYSQSLTIRREIGDKRGEANTFNNTGVAHWKLGQYQEALDHYRKALEIRRNIGDKRGEGSTLTSIGAVHNSQRQYQEALNYYRQALEIRRNIGDKRGEGITLNSMGMTYHNLGQYQEAYKLFQASIDIHEALGTIDNLWIAQRGLASVEVQLNQPESAITHYENALNTIETLRAGIAEKEHKLSFMQDKMEVYDELIELLRVLHQDHPDKGYDRKALEIFERKQGRVFLEEMGKSGARLFAGLPESIKHREEQLDTQLEQIRQYLADERAKNPQDHERIHELEQQKKTLQAEQEALQSTIKTEYPDYYALRYPQPVALSELLNTVLQPGELMLVYNVMKEHTLLWVISSNPPLPLPGGENPPLPLPGGDDTPLPLTSGDLWMYTLPVGEKVLREKVANAREGMLYAWGTSRGLSLTRKSSAPEAIEPIPFTQSSYDLYSVLIPEDLRSLLTDRNTLNIVPTGPLYALPFEALITHPVKNKASQSSVIASESEALSMRPRYLIEDVPISYLSSASLLKTLRDAKARRTVTAGHPFLAFAHPVYSLDASQDTGTVRSLRSEAYRELLGGGIAELPETAEEAKTVASLFNAPEETQPVQLRWDASCTNVFAFNTHERLDDYQYLLFAMHGVLPGEVSRLTQSALILSDYFLTMADVFSLKLNAKLVALSACNTGMGKQIRGEGVMGLTRSFMYAGTPAVAVTLWSVESLSAKTLSIGMFRHLKEGYTPARALRAIKIRMLRGEEGQDYRQPYYWAPFVVFGDGL